MPTSCRLRSCTFLQRGGSNPEYFEAWRAIKCIVEFLVGDDAVAFDEEFVTLCALLGQRPVNEVAVEQAIARIDVFAREPWLGRLGSDSE